MEFTNPIALWGLTGLVIPVAIHLLSLKEGQVIRIGSLRHLEETNSRQFRGIRLNELLLLFLRMFFIIWIVFFIGGLQIDNAFVQPAKWVVIEKGLENDNNLAPLIDSLQKDDFEVRYLMENFPLVSAGRRASFTDDYWQLVEDLKHQSLQEVVVIASNRIASFKGRRISLSDNMRWISKPASSQEFIISTIQTSKDSIWVRSGKSDAEKTFFETSHQSSDQVEITLPDTLSVFVIYSEAFQQDTKMMLAALKTIDAALPQYINIKTSMADPLNMSNEQNWIIWLSDEVFPHHVESHTILFSERLSNTLFEQSDFNRWVLTRHLNEDVSVQENLTLQLATILFPSKNEWALASWHDRRMLPDTFLESTMTAPSGVEENMSHSPTCEKIWLTLILVTLIIERLVAYKRNQ